ARGHAVAGVDFDAVIKLKLAVGIVQQSMLGLEFGGDVIAAEEVAIDIDELDGRLLSAELHDRPFGAHLIAAAVLGHPEIARVLHGQIVGRELDLTEVQSSRANLPGAIEGEEISRPSSQG